MSNVSFGNLSNNQQLSPTIEQRVQSQENFGAVDREKLKQDTVEIAKNTHERVKENFVFRILKNTFGIEDPKKFLISAGLMIGTVLSFATLGNKFNKQIIAFSQNIDKKILNSEFFGNISTGIGKIKQGISDFFDKFNFTKNLKDNLVDTFKNRKAQPTQKMAKTLGPKGQFAANVSDTVQALHLKFHSENFDMLKKGLGGKKAALEFLKYIDEPSSPQYLAGLEAIKKKLSQEDYDKLMQGLEKSHKAFKGMLEKLVGSDNFDYFYKNFTEIETDADRAGFAKKLTEAIAKQKGLETNSDYAENLTKVLEDIYNDETFKNITMNRESPITSWFPVNIIDSIGSKISKNWKPFGKGNLGDALIKFNMADGTLAQTGLGKFIQKAPLYTTESISNHVADLSTMNLFITIPALMSLFNSVQEAPKEQKVATLADEFVAGLGSFVFSMPLASSIVYSIATLKNLKGNNPLKLIGKIIGMGLPTIAENGTITQTNKFLPRYLGGAMRFILVMFVISPKISGVISKAVQKIFGKPYNKDEAEKLKALEEQKKQVIPELGITQGELMEKMEKNPQAIQKLQTDPKLAQTIAQNPKALLDLLDGKEVKYIEAPKSPASQGQILSPANKDRLNNKTNNNTIITSTTNNNTINNNAENKTTTQQSPDTATYIPSSEFSAKSTTLSAEQQSEYDALMTKADKALLAAEKYI